MKHRKVHRDLEDLSNPSLHKARGKVLKEFIDESTDKKHAEELLESLDYIEEKLSQD